MTNDDVRRVPCMELERYTCKSTRMCRRLWEGFHHFVEGAIPAYVRHPARRSRTWLVFLQAVSSSVFIRCILYFFIHSLRIYTRSVTQLFHFKKKKTNFRLAKTYTLRSFETSGEKSSRRNRTRPLGRLAPPPRIQTPPGPRDSRHAISIRLTSTQYRLLETSKAEKNFFFELAHASLDKLW